MPRNHAITIFIHGTLPPTLILKIPAVRYFLSSPAGLNAITGISTRYHNVQLAYALIKHDPENFHEKHFYLYGWSGGLTAQARKHAAKRLAKEIKQLLTQFSVLPLIHIIAHSHGGNVALELATQDKDLLIDELILLACPVQEETAEYVHSPVFKTIYSIHSHLDVIQVLDPQGTHNFYQRYNHYGFLGCLEHSLCLTPFFSRRHFPAAAHLTQVQVLVNKRNLLHIEFIFTSFFNKLPIILKYVQQHHYVIKEPDRIVSV